ncbi:MAG: hypothetical protein RL329_1086 [Bacteroidota bacterium]|jgi:hypothetical protein
MNAFFNLKKHPYICTERINVQLINLKFKALWFQIEIEIIVPFG